MARSRPRQHATRTRRQVTPEWIISVRNALRDLGHGLRWLEIEAGLAKGAATKILDGDQQTSTHVDAISKVLGLALPTAGSETAEEAELLAIFRGMTPEGKEHLLGLLRLLARPGTQH
jgi:hypothetical protein